VNAGFNHPALLGTYLAIMVVLLLGVAAHAWSRFRAAPLVLAGPMLLAVAATFTTLSRGPLLGMAAGITVVVLLTVARRRLAALIPIVVLCLAAVTLAVPQLPASQREAYLERFQQLQEPGSESGRRLIYRQAAIIIADHPLTGVGPLTFGEITKERTTVFGIEANFTHAHNVVLEGFLSLGPLGLLALVVLVVGATRRLWAELRRPPEPASALIEGWTTGALGVLTTLLVAGMVNFPFWQLELLTALLLVIGVAYALARDRDPAAARVRSTGG
jgi:O-antigen ligase